jgi:hypothetical protein
VTVFGVSAPFVQSCLKAGLRPRDDHDLPAVRVLGSAGSPLSAEGFRWIGDAVGRHIQICSDRYINIHQRAGSIPHLPTGSPPRRSLMVVAARDTMFPPILPWPRTSATCVR